MNAFEVYLLSGLCILIAWLLLGGTLTFFWDFSVKAYFVVLVLLLSVYMLTIPVGCIIGAVK